MIYYINLCPLMYFMTLIMISFQYIESSNNLITHFYYITQNTGVQHCYYFGKKEENV